MYDPDERISKLADLVDKDAPVSRLNLFSPCKVDILHSIAFCFYLQFQIIGFFNLYLNNCLVFHFDECRLMFS